MSELIISGLRGGIGEKEILKGVDLVVRSGEVHALMGPNGSGKSTLGHILMGNTNYFQSGGTISLDGIDLSEMPTHERAHRGLFLGFQYPVELNGVTVEGLVGAATGVQSGQIAARVHNEAAKLRFGEQFLERGVNEEFSGGEKKKSEILQMTMLNPKIAILDEIDSGLDIDALGDVGSAVRRSVDQNGLAVLAITHYARLLTQLPPDFVHIMRDGRIVGRGGPELPAKLEEIGYEGLFAELS